MIKTKKAGVIRKAGVKKPAKARPGLKRKLIPRKKKATPARVKEAPAKSSAKVKVEFYPIKSYNEEYQITGFHYAFLSSDNKMCHHWVKCRDFLQDALRNQLTGRNDAIYSFAYKPKTDPTVDTNRTRMLIKRIPHPKTAAEKKEFEEMLKYSLKLVNHYEKIYKYAPLSKLVKVDDANNDQYVYLFLGPGIWSQGSVMVSIYTFLMRLGYFKPEFKDDKSLTRAYEKIFTSPPGGKHTNDTGYLKRIYKNFHPALEHAHEHLFKPKGWKEGNKILFHDSIMNQFHHNSGIVKLSAFSTPEKKLNDKFRKIFATKR